MLKKAEMERIAFSQASQNVEMDPNDGIQQLKTLVLAEINLSI